MDINRFWRNLTVLRHYFNTDEINVDISDNNAVNDDHLKFSFKEQCVITDMEDLRAKSALVLKPMQVAFISSPCICHLLFTLYSLEVPIWTNFKN